jgi:cold-inducible RNA-binding protein
METKLYVGNLSYDTSEAELQDLFGQAGEVKSAQIIQDRDTGRSKGFGFVVMGTEDEAQKAIDLLNGKQLGGRALTVSIARPREERSGGGRDSQRGGYGGGRGRGSGGGRRQDW